MSARAHFHPSLWFDLEEQARFFARLNRALLLSLALHLVILLVAAGLRLPQRGERPLASVEVSLVSSPSPVKHVELQKSVEQPKPPVRSAPAPPVKLKEEASPMKLKEEPSIPTPRPAPMTMPTPISIPTSKPTSVPMPMPAPIAIPTSKLSPVPMPVPVPATAPVRESVAKDILRDLQLPPDAPKLGELTPAKAVAQPQPQVAKIKIPELPRLADVVPDRAVKAPQQTSLSEDQNRELEEELKKVKQFQPAAKLEVPKEAPAKPLPQQEASIPTIKTPQTMLKTAGSSGTNPYWARVEAIIKSQWEPPPIDVSGSTYTVVVKFRFFRNGTVKEVGVQQSSGNEYFDMAGQRAVQKPHAFPPFPADMTEAYQDVEMIFRVGEAAG